MVARLPFAVRVGLALILIGSAVLGGWAWWAATRIWVPLDVPISLARGHIRTPEFEINVASTYWFYIQVGREAEPVGGPCAVGSACPFVSGISWSLSKGGRVIEKAKIDLSVDVVVWSDAEKGRYVLDLDVWQDGSRLNAGAPRLVVIERGNAHVDCDAQGARALLVFLLFAAAGSYAIIWSAIMRRREKRDASAGACSLTQPGPQPRELQIDSQAPALTSAQPGFRSPLLFRIGAGLILAGLGVSVWIHHWMATRTFVAVDMPVTLGHGHLRTGPFLINLSEWYSISVHTDWSHPRRAGCDEDNVLQTRWVLYRNGRTARRSDDNGHSGGFDAEKGLYDLDLEVLADASCLNSTHPRLRVSTSPTVYADFYSLPLWLCVAGIGVGAVLLTIVGMGRVRKTPAPVAPCVPSGTAGGHYYWRPRRAHRRIISGMPSFGLIAGIVFLGLMLLFFVFQFGTFPPKGLIVHLVRPGVPTQSSPWLEPLRVRVEVGGPNLRPKLFFNSQPISWEDLGTVLAKELNRRPPHFPVYVEGGPDLLWNDVAVAIDLIRGLQGEVVLLTAATESPRKPDGK